MTFGAPWMLLGALAALIPLLVHLFDRRRPRPHPFGPIAFVLRSQRRTASRLKLKRLLLYTLRTLILLAIPLALARPEWAPKQQTAQVARGVAATSIVLDASLSMRWADGSSLFERAKDQAREALRELAAEEPANLIVCNEAPTVPGAPGFDRAGLRVAVDEAQPSYGAADLTRCLELAARSLEDSPLPGKRLVLVSDFAAHALRLESPAPVVKGAEGALLRPEVVLRDAAEGHDRLPNRSVVDLKVEPALQVGPRAYQFTFTVRNHSDAPMRDVEATLRVEGRVVAKGFVDLPPHGSAQKSLTHRFELPPRAQEERRGAAVVEGDVGIEADALTDDDRQPFVVHVPRELSVLVVNGGPHAVRHRDEAFFVEAALRAPGTPVQTAVRDVDAAFREDFAAYDVVLLLNVPAPDEEAAARLTAFVERGGGLFVAMGDHVDPDAYNQRLGAVLPRALRLTKTAATPDEPDADRRAAKLTRIEEAHPVLSPFVGDATEGLLGARFYRYMLLEPDGSSPGGGSEVLASFEDGAPALAAARRGDGRVLLLTSTVDRDWSDFAIRTSFLPLVQRMSAYLGGALEERAELRPKVGERAVLRTKASQRPTRLKSPSGQALGLTAQEDGTLLTEPLREPGLYSPVSAEGTPLPALAFAVTPPTTESDLSRLPVETLRQYFGEETVRSATSGATERKVPLWTWLLSAAALAFFFEGVLLRRP